jgi:hypothetical protein
MGALPVTILFAASLKMSVTIARSGLISILMITNDGRQQQD